MKNVHRMKRPLLLLLLAGLLTIPFSGCGSPFACLFGCVSHSPPGPPIIRPINTTHIPHVVVVEEIDGPPLQPAKWGIASLSMLADKIDASIIPGEDGIEVFIGAITSKSIQYGLLAFHVPPIPPDTAKPVLQVCPTEADAGETPTHYADRVAACQTANDSAIANWQAFLKTNHALLAQVQAQVKHYTDAMRKLQPVTDPIADDISGALVDATSHFAHYTGKKVLLLESPMENNTAIDQSQTINLTGAKVSITFFTCAVAVQCDQKKSFWSHQLILYGASSVEFYSPQDTLVATPTF